MCDLCLAITVTTLSLVKGFRASTGISEPPVFKSDFKLKLDLITQINREFEKTPPQARAWAHTLDRGLNIRFDVPGMQGFMSSSDGYRFRGIVVYKHFFLTKQFLEGFFLKFN